MLSELNQIQKERSHGFSLLWDIDTVEIQAVL
jgi:hypothetical protein